MTVICPCCNRPMEAARAPIEAISSAPLGPVERRIIEALVKAYPKPIKRGRLAEIIYGNEMSGGPDNAGVVISITMSSLRQKLLRLGWTIPKARVGPGSEGYHLEPISPIEDIAKRAS